MLEHSPAPWRRENHAVRCADGRQVAMLLKLGGPDLLPLPWGANGDLIEQAPAMLALLERLVAAVERGEGLTVLPGSPTHAEARWLIALARGEGERGVQEGG
jgi:hypothetical protein